MTQHVLIDLFQIVNSLNKSIKDLNRSIKMFDRKGLNKEVKQCVLKSVEDLESRSSNV